MDRPNRDMIRPVRSRGNGTWLPDGRCQIRVTVTLPNGVKKKKAVHGRTLRDAQAAAAKLRATKPKAATTLFEDLVELYREGPLQSLSAKTVEAYEWAIGPWLARWAKLPVGSVTVPS